MPTSPTGSLTKGWFAEQPSRSLILEPYLYQMINSAARYYTYYYAARPTGCGTRLMRV